MQVSKADPAPAAAFKGYLMALVKSLAGISDKQPKEEYANWAKTAGQGKEVVDDMIAKLNTKALKAATDGTDFAAELDKEMKNEDSELYMGVQKMITDQTDPTEVLVDAELSKVFKAGSLWADNIQP